jgi:hypothetical protein
MRAFFMNEKLNDQGLGDFPNQEAPNLSVHIKELKKAYKMIFRSQQIHSNV